MMSSEGNPPFRFAPNLQREFDGPSIHHHTRICVVSLDFAHNLRRDDDGILHCEQFRSG